jgi:hypothetical protein
VGCWSAVELVVDSVALKTYESTKIGRGVQHLPHPVEDDSPKDANISILGATAVSRTSIA